MATRTKKKTVSHALFWTLIKQIPGYNEKYKDVIKEGLVNRFSEEKTSSLSEMYKKYPAQYSRMIDYMKGGPEQIRNRYDKTRDETAKRVIAAICGWLDKLGYQYPSRYDKINYAKRVACRASNCCDFNQIPLSKMDAVYSLYCKKNSVNIDNVALDYIVAKN